MPENPDQEYTGVENLEIMAEAINYNRFLHQVISARARSDDQIVDFGAGSGTFARPLREAGYRVCCIEPAPELRVRLASVGLSVRDDLATLADASVDYLYTLNVLEHIEDDRQVLRQFHRVLKPSGRLLIYVPAFAVLYSSMDRKVGHYRRYRRPDLVARTMEAGLRVTYARYVDSLGFPASLLYRLTDPGTGRINRRALKAYDRMVFPVSRMLDRVTGRLFGKNLLLRAHKP